MPDIVLKKDGGAVRVKLQILNGDQAASSCELWITDPAQPDHYKKDKDVKKSSDPEDAFYPAGDDKSLTGRVIEWVWTAVPAPGSALASGTARIHVEQNQTPVAGYPHDLSFTFNGDKPVTYSFSRHFKVS